MCLQHSAFCNSMENEMPVLMRKKCKQRRYRRLSTLKQTGFFPVLDQAG